MIKITVKELVARYVLEPDLKDVFVEGATDAWVYSNEMSDNPNVKIWPIERVDVVVDSGGHRARVIELSECLSREKLNGSWRAIIDRDVNEPLPSIDGLLFTDYSCLEAYYFDDEIMDVLFDNYLISDVKWQNYKDVVSVTLNQLSEIRMTLKSRVPAVKLPSRKKYIYWNEGVLVFDKSAFLTSCCSLGVSEGEFTCKHSDVDVRMVMNGHDMMELLSIVCSKIESEAKLKCPNLMTRILTGISRTKGTLAKYTLMKDLKKFSLS